MMSETDKVLDKYYCSVDGVTVIVAFLLIRSFRRN